MEEILIAPCGMNCGLEKLKKNPKYRWGDD
jgi:hypothetical protein